MGKRALGVGVVCVVYMLGFFLLLGSGWLKQNFAIENFDQILFHLRFPLLDTDSMVVWDFLHNVALPSVMLAVLCSLTPSYVRFLRLYRWARLGFMYGLVAGFVWLVLCAMARGISFGNSSGVLLACCWYVLTPAYAASFVGFCGAKIYARYGLRLRFGGVAQGVLACIALILCANVMNNKLHISTYIAKGEQEYGELYEKYYVLPKFLAHRSEADLERSAQPRSTLDPHRQNLIIILAESLESTFSNGGGGGNSSHLVPFGDLIPHLSALAKKHINFSATNAIGGLTQVAGTGWTMAGTIAHLCGIPLTMPIGGNAFINKYFLDSAICVSDVLADLGYTQAYVSGLDSSFAGMKYFLSSHAISVLDLPYWQLAGKIPTNIPKELQGFWGIKDSVLLQLAKDTLPTLTEPFALYVSTIDTHGPNGFVDPHACAGIENDYQGSFTCADRFLADFIAYAQRLYGDSVSIVVVGDHLTGGFFLPNVDRYVFDLFINPKFTATYTRKSTKFRTLSHFDIAPLLLDSVGIKTEYFGLGRNPLYGPTLLESTFTPSEFNAQISKKSRLYDSFWDIGQKSSNYNATLCR